MKHGLLVALLTSCSSASGASPDLPLPKVDLAAKPGTKQATAVFAAGCFWCSEAVFEQIAGVTEVVSGYAGGRKEDADYHKVSAGGTNHAESIRITYDPSKVTYGQLLRVLFTLFDPTQLDGQGPDWGHQYRFAIFYGSEDEKRVARAYIEQLTAAKVFPKPIVTTLEPLSASGFYPAEGYHQDYVKHNPDDPYVRANSLPKIQKVRAKFVTQAKPAGR
jgi:peptide-methionine (S)-S-oxide reductase